MALIKYEPWSTFSDMQRMFNQLFDTRYPTKEGDMSNVSTSEWSPSVDIKEEDNKFIVTADVPGVDPNKIDVHMENGMLSIQGERESEQKQETKNYSRIERIKGTFYRRFTLPESADSEKIAAKCDKGVLEIIIPKTTKTASKRKIQVQSN